MNTEGAHEGVASCCWVVSQSKRCTEHKVPLPGILLKAGQLIGKKLCESNREEIVGTRAHVKVEFEVRRLIFALLNEVKRRQFPHHLET